MTTRLVLVAIFLSACQPSQPPTLAAEEEAQIAEEVKATVDAYFEAFRALDAERMREFWTDEEDFAMASDGAVLVGYDTWTDGMEERLQSFKEVGYAEISNEQIYVLSRDAASFIMEFRWSRTLGGRLMPPGSRVVVGRPSIQKWVGRFLDSYELKVKTFAFDDRAIGDIVAFCRWAATGTYQKRGRQNFEFDQKYLDTIVKDSDGKWRFAVHMWSPNTTDWGVWDQV